MFMHQMHISTTLCLYNGTRDEKVGIQKKKCKNSIRAQKIREKKIKMKIRKL
jgi:hypothetical protein